MTKTFKNGTLAFLAAMIGTAAFTFLLFGEARSVEGQIGGDHWRNFIYDFQSLITGIMAVSAAAVTVIQMRISDDRSEVRHQQAMKLQIRSDVLLIDRLLMPHFHILGDFLRELKGFDLVAPIDANAGLTPKQTSTAQQIRDELRELVRLILEAPGWNDAKPLFGGLLARDVHFLRLIIDICITKAATCGESINLPFDEVIDEVGTTRGQIDRGYQLDAWNDLCIQVPQVIRGIEVILDRLRNLAETYELEELVGPGSKFPMY